MHLPTCIDSGKLDTFFLRSFIGRVCACVIGLSLTMGAINSTPTSFDITKEVADAFGLESGEMVRLELKQPYLKNQQVGIAIDGNFYTVELQYRSIRTPDFVYRIQVADGSYEDRVAPPSRTFRGRLLEDEGSRVVGSMLESGFAGKIVMSDGREYFVEPVSAKLANVEPGMHLVYQSTDTRDPGCTCGNPDHHHDLATELDAYEQNIRSNGRSGDGSTVGTSGPAVAELAVDADVQYFNDYGSEAATLDRMELIVNVVNDQYERDVDITHVISGSVIRTVEPDPYTSSDSFGLLQQFRNEWLANQGGIPRDVAHLFTGRDINGSVIGRAWDIGAICNDDAYCFSQSDFNGNFGCATDLTAHELGHLWNGVHCSCPNHTMNPGITCTNIFNPNFTVPDIVGYRNTRDCLDDSTPTNPPNDDLADSANIGSSNSTVNGSNINATTEAGEPQLGTTGSTVWWHINADQDGTFTIDTFGSDYDTQLHIYTGGGSGTANLNPVVNNDDAVPGSILQSEVTFTAVAGTRYEIRVGGYRPPGNTGDGAEGNITLNSTFVPDTSGGPENDNFADSIEIATLDFSTTGTNIDATTQTDEQQLANTGSTVWWYIEADADGMLTVDTFGSNFDTQLHIFTGFESGFPNLVPLVNNDDAVPGSVLQSEVTFSVTAGTFYEIRVGGWRPGGSTGPGDEGNIVINGTFIPDGMAPPNDDFANSINIPSLDFMVKGSNVEATTQTGEQQLQNTGSTVWWHVDAAENGTLTVDTLAANYDTQLHIYSGSENGFPNLVPIVNNDDVEPGTLQSLVSFEVDAGTRYEIRVGGWRPGGSTGPGDEGDIVLMGSFEAEKKFVLGDVNCDGAVTLADIPAFVELLSNGGYSNKADINEDGELTLADIPGFVAILSGG